MDAAIVNAFKSSAEKVMHMNNLSYSLKGLKKKVFPYDMAPVIIQVGVLGDFKGTVILNSDKENVNRIGKSMMGGMEMDFTINMSAVSELMNQIVGNFSTAVYNINHIVDITPPVTLIGENIQISAYNSTLLSLDYEAELYGEISKIQLDMVFISDTKH